METLALSLMYGNLTDQEYCIMWYATKAPKECQDLTVENKFKIMSQIAPKNLGQDFQVVEVGYRKVT